MSERTTVKQVLQALKNTRGQLCVFSFDPYEKKERVSKYISCNFLQAFNAISRRLAEGRLVVITNNASARELEKIEEQEKRRVTYEEAYPHSIVFFSNEEELDTIKIHQQVPLR